MNRKLSSLGAIALFATLGHGAAVAAGLSDYDIDNRFRAKIAKEKTKQNLQQAQSFNFNQPPAPDCGSQQIGNVQTNGRIGASPREVFVFAPNSVNVVSGNGCR